LASALEQVIDEADFETLSVAAAASVNSASWDDAGSRVDAILRAALGQAQRPATRASRTVRLVVEG
jgi:hypothetical protein